MNCEAKHAWGFVNNFTEVKMKYSAKGSSGSASIKGLYKCKLCGKERVGAMRHDAPGNDLRGSPIDGVRLAGMKF